MRAGPLALAMALVLAPLPAGAGDFGSLSIWDISGVTGDAESYENQLSFVLSPSLRLGRVWKGAPALAAPLTLSAELSLGVELAGNDARFRGAQFSGPAATPGGAESLAINAQGQVVNAQAGQADGTGKRALLTDLWLGLSHPKLYRVPLAGVDLGARLAVILPTSTASQATGLYASPGLGISLGRSFWSERLSLGYSLRYTHYLYRHATNDFRSMGGEVIVNGRPEPVYQPNRGTSLNPNFAVINELWVEGKIIAGLSAAASYSLINTFTHALEPVELETLPLADPCADGQAVAVATGGEVNACGERSQRDAHWFRFHLSYQVLPQLGISAGLSTYQPVRHEGAGVSNPFIQTVPTTNYTTVELGLRLEFEETAGALRALGGLTDEGKK